MPYYPQPNQSFTITQVSDINIAHQWKRTSGDTLCCTNTIPANQTICPNNETNAKTTYYMN